MSLEEFYYVSQIIASVAVLASLIYLGVQTRQTSLNQRAAARANQVQGAISAIQTLANPPFASVFRDGAAASPDMSVMEAHQFAMRMRALFMLFQEQHKNWRVGLLDDEAWAPAKGALEAGMSSPGYRAAYKMWRPTFNTSFQELGDAALAQTKGNHGVDVGAAWLALAAEERAALDSAASPIERR